MLQTMSSSQLARWSAFYKVRANPRKEIAQRSIHAWRKMMPSEREREREQLYRKFKDWAILAGGKKVG